MTRYLLGNITVYKQLFLLLWIRQTTCCNDILLPSAVLLLTDILTAIYILCWYSSCSQDFEAKLVLLHKPVLDPGTLQRGPTFRMSRLRSFWTSKRKVWATLKRCELWNKPKIMRIKLPVVSNIQQSHFIIKWRVLYLLFAELPDRQDVLAHQQVQQRGGLEVGHLSSSHRSLSWLRGQQPGQRRRVAVTVTNGSWWEHNHLCTVTQWPIDQLNTGSR